MKILYFDTETTGRDDHKHEITQLAIIVEINGEVKEEVSWRCQPTNWDVIEQGALDVTGVGIEELKKLPPPEEMFKNLMDLFDRYVSKFDRAPQKFYPAGHNVGFDLKFLDAFIKKHGNADNQKWGITSYQNWRSLDSRVMANFFLVKEKIFTDDVRLETLCKFYGIDISAHDALSDIRATRSLIQRMMQEIK
jgi:DNA polymerase III epsilon subunit-like protein